MELGFLGSGERAGGGGAVVVDRRCRLGLVVDGGRRRSWVVVSR